MTCDWFGVFGLLGPSLTCFPLRGLHGVGRPHVLAFVFPMTELPIAIDIACSHYTGTCAWKTEGLSWNISRTCRHNKYENPLVKNMKKYYTFLFAMMQMRHRYPSTVWYALEGPLKASCQAISPSYKWYYCVGNPHILCSLVSIRGEPSGVNLKPYYPSYWWGSHKG